MEDRLCWCEKTRAGVAILGAGFMGTMHAAALRQLQVLADEDAVLPRLVAVADSDPRGSEELAVRFEIPMWTTDWQSLIDDPRVDVVTIATPNNVHVDMATAAPAAESTSTARSRWEPISPTPGGRSMR